MTIQQVLAENLKALMDAQRPPMSGRQVAARAEIDQKTVSRMLNCANSPTLGALAAVAEVFGLLPWQLLVPGLDPKDPPFLKLTKSEAEMYGRLQRAISDFGDLDKQ